MSDDDTIGVIDQMMTRIRQDEERGIPRRVAIAYHVAAVHRDIITVRATSSPEPEPEPEPEPAATPTARAVGQTIRTRTGRRLEQQTQRQLLRGLAREMRYYTPDSVARNVRDYDGRPYTAATIARWVEQRRIPYQCGEDAVRRMLIGRRDGTLDFPLRRRA